MNARRARSALAVAVAVVAAPTLAACANLNSEVATLKPVAGDAITGLNIAVNDVLLDNDVAIQVAPVCKYSDAAYTCAGTTMTGAKIVGSADGESPTTMTVTVGGRTIYTGSIQEVLQKAGRR